MVGWEHLVFPAVEQDPMVLAAALQFWRKAVRQAGGTG